LKTFTAVQSLTQTDDGEASQKLCILVVDDDSVSRLMMSILLRQAGHRVLLADGGRSALEQLNDETVDLVLLDLSMPDLDGFAVLNIYRARPSSRWQPVIVVSANETEALILQALEAGADDYMTKPIDRGFLMAKIRNFSRGISIQRKNLSLFESLREKQQALLDRRAYEMELGRRIQSTLLLGTLPPDPGGFRVSARAEAAAGVNGDFLEVLSLSPHSVDLVVGDVMGKGMLAALMGAQVKLQIARTIAERVATTRGRLPSPAEIVNAIHSELSPKLQDLDSFVTLAYIRMDRSRSELLAVCCGQMPPLLLREGQAIPVGAQHVPLGVLLDEVYTESIHPLQPGDALISCSDGVTEARRTNGDMFGETLFIEAALRANSFNCGAAPLLESIRLAVTDFLGGAAPNDDLTLLVAIAPHDPELTRRIEVPRMLGEISTVRRFVQAFCTAWQVPAQAMDRIELATIEVFSNIVRHSQTHLERPTVEILMRHTAQRVSLVMESLGEPFDPPPPDFDFEPSPGSEGGFGLYIIQLICDELRFEHSHGINRVALEFDRERA
jgi:serine phosphatase RsbU (regulator of sigma subunit)/anti-sigma regulatory factor (Ser/Thr protein kinase)